MQQPCPLIEMQPTPLRGAEGSEWLNELRSTLAESVQATGLPTRKDEDWKYSDPRSLRNGSFVPAQPTTVPFEIGDECIGIHLVNGWLQTPSIDDGRIAVSPIAEIVESNEKLLCDILSGFEGRSDAFMRMNHVLFGDGVLVHIKKTVQKPIVIRLDLRRPDSLGVDKAVAAFPKVIIVVDEGAEATVVEDHVSTSKGAFSNVAIHTRVAAGAKLTQLCVFDSCDGASVIHEIDGVSEGNHEIVAVHLSGGYHRTNTSVRLTKPGAKTRFDGLMLGKGRAHLDIHSVFDHEVPECSSEQLVKSVLGDEARGVFNGKVIFRKDAQKSETVQENHNILLSRKAEVDAKPELEIYADDVKASHGSTIGQLDEKALFYLQSRGIDKKEASSMLIHAFVSEVTEKIPEGAVREFLEGRLQHNVQETLQEKPVHD